MRRPTRISGRELILVKDLDDETLAAIMNAEPSEESRRLNYLMEEEASGSEE